jgi:hypothetical protein
MTGELACSKAQAPTADGTGPMASRPSLRWEFHQVVLAPFGLPLQVLPALG